MWKPLPLKKICISSLHSQENCISLPNFPTSKIFFASKETFVSKNVHEAMPILGFPMRRQKVCDLSCLGCCCKYFVQNFPHLTVMSLLDFQGSRRIMNDTKQPDSPTSSYPPKGLVWAHNKRHHGCDYSVSICDRANWWCISYPRCNFIGLDDCVVLIISISYPTHCWVSERC